MTETSGSPSKRLDSPTAPTSANSSGLFNRAEGSVAKKSIEIKLQGHVLAEKSTKVVDPKSSLYGKWEKYEQPAKNPEINKLTNLCREISAKEGYDDTENKMEVTDVSHPFHVAPASAYPSFYKGKPTVMSKLILSLFNLHQQ